MSNQVEVIDCHMHSMNKGQEVAYVVEYSEGTTVRAVVTRDGWIRLEAFDTKHNEWKETCKPYIVKRDKKRQGERIIARVKEFLKK